MEMISEGRLRQDLDEVGAGATFGTSFVVIRDDRPIARIVPG